jgi:hypothetical protein
MPWLIAWGLGLTVIVPWSLLARIRHEDWPDIELPDTNAPAEEA